MRRKFFNGKRVLALVLSLSLVMGEAVFATPIADAQPAAVEETADADVLMAEDTAVQDDVAEELTAEDVIFEEADGDAGEAEAQEAADENAALEIVSANDVADTEAQEATDEDAQENTLQEADEGEETQEDALAVEEAADGTLSKVIGLEGSDGYNGSFKNDDGEPVERYTNVWTYQDRIYVKGKLTPDAKTGWVTYNGKTYLGGGYSYNQATDESSLDPYYEISVLPGTSTSDYKDSANGLYKINGNYYSNISTTQVDGVTKLYYYPNRGTAIPVTLSDNYDEKAINKTYGRYTKTAAYYGETDPQDLYYHSPSYYVIGGKVYDSIDYKGVYQGGKYRYCWYVLQSDEISLSNRTINVSWKSLSNPNINLDQYQPKAYVMYEVKVNGQPAKNLSHYYDAKGNVYYCTGGSNSYTTKEAYAAGQGVKLQVRGVFYHYVNKQYTNEDGEQVASDVVVIDGAGPWSDEYSYSVTGQKRAQVPAVTGVTATEMTVIDGYNSVLVKWNPVPQANYYYVYVVASKKQLAMTVADFEKYFNKDTQFLAQKGLTAADLQTDSTSTSYPEWTHWEYEADTEFLYRYYAVVPTGVADYDLYENKVSSLDKITTFASVKMAEKAVAKTPALQNFKAEKQADGTVDLVWDKVDANVVIYAYDQSTFPKMFQYKPFESDVVRVEYKKDAAGNIIKDSNGRPQFEKTASLYSDMRGYYVFAPAMEKSVVNINQQDRAAYQKVEYKSYVTGSNGRLSDVIGNMGLVKGRTYYFVACTYDTDTLYRYYQESSTGAYKSFAKAPITNSFTGRYYENGIAKTTAVNASYTYYPALGPLTGVVSVKAKASKPTVQTLPDKKSIKLSLSNGMGTGYEIYRKAGKKYKKIATTTSNVYVDEGLKTGASYSYKVRSYYYDMGAKKTVYSDWRYVTTKTIPADAFELHAVKSSKTGVKLNWNKVAKATKYELYRSDLKNSDPNVISKKYSAAGFKRSLSSTGYKLIKTLSKGKTTYTDKKLKADEEYSYIIIAYYKDGKSTQMMLAGDSVVLAVTEPANIKAVNKGSKVVVSWDADKYAAGYEIEYYLRDKYGVKKSSVPVTVTTKKNSLTISGIETGGYVSGVRVRAYNSKKEYSEWVGSISSEDISLGAVKGITAKAVTAKNGTQGVKISWKKVSGAKYYKVYRSTQMPVYDADEKLYRTDYGYAKTSIAKEGNDNYAKEDSISSLTGGYLYNNEVYYDEYMGVSNSVTGTTAYDYGTLAGGVTYYYTVVAFGEVPSGGSDSYVKSVYCSKPGSVTAKSNLNVKATSKKGKVTLKWSKIAGTSGVKYTIYRSNKAKGKYTKIGTTKKTSFTDKKSKKGKTYYYKVAVTSGKNALKADFTVTSPAKKVKAK